MATIIRPGRHERAAAVAPARRIVYVFELPVRLVHWVIVLCLIVLSATGLYIGHPFQAGNPVPARPGFTLGEVRFIHEVTAFVFIAAVLVRIYWAFVGNRYTHWRGLLPVTEAQRRDLVTTLRFYFFRGRDPARTNGHNPLAGLAYVLLYVLFLMSIFTGLGLYAWILRTGVWPSLFIWTWIVMSVPDLRLFDYVVIFVYGGLVILLV
jgi:Ni/Fe-hydrogenase 1 B-type cytochrome subunit